MHTQTTIEVRWFAPSGSFGSRSMRKEFDDVQSAKDFKDAQAARHPDRGYRVVKITVEEVA